MENNGRDRTRSLIRVMVGGYLLYLAYSLFREQMQGNGSSTTVFLLFVIVFTVFGAGLIITGLRNFLKLMKQEMEEPEEELPGDDSETDEK